MLKIEQFVKEQFDITLTPKQLEIIAIFAGKGELPKYDLNDDIVAYKAATAYLQDGMTEAKSE